MRLLRAHKKMACLRETLHIAIQFRDVAGAHSQWNLFHITFGAGIRFKSNAFPSKALTTKDISHIFRLFKTQQGKYQQIFLQVRSLINWGE